VARPSCIEVLPLPPAYDFSGTDCGSREGLGLEQEHGRVPERVHGYGARDRG
jgi:hypothetical protein